MFDLNSKSEVRTSDGKGGREMMNNGMTLVVKLPLIDSPDLREKMTNSLNEFMNDAVTKLIIGSIKIDFPLANAEDIKEKANRAVSTMITEDVSNHVRQMITINQDEQNIFAH